MKSALAVTIGSTWLVGSVVLFLRFPVEIGLFGGFVFHEILQMVLIEILVDLRQLILEHFLLLRSAGRSFLRVAVDLIGLFDLVDEPVRVEDELEALGVGLGVSGLIHFGGLFSVVGMRFWDAYFGRRVGLQVVFGEELLRTGQVRPTRAQIPGLANHASGAFSERVRLADSQHILVDLNQQVSVLKSRMLLVLELLQNTQVFLERPLGSC